MIFQLIANGIPMYEKEDGSALPKTDDEVLLALIMAQASEKKNRTRVGKTRKAGRF